jgi:peroxiredoxin
MDSAVLVAGLGDLSTAERLTLVGGVVGLGLLAAEGWLLVHLLGQIGRVLVRFDALETRLAADAAPSGLVPTSAAPAPGLPLGAPAPGFGLSGLYGETMTLDALRAPGKPVLLVFSDPGCSPCDAILPEVGQWQRQQTAQLTVALLSRGMPEANRAKATEHGLTNVLLQPDREVAVAYEAAATPTGVIVRPDGTIGSPLAPGAEAIRALVAETIGAPAPGAATAPAPAPAPAAPLVPLDAPSASANGNGTVVPPAPTVPAVGDPAPMFAVPDLSGRTVSLAEFRGHPTLILFWNPGCGFCARMLDDLKAWAANPPPGAPTLLVVSAGTLETTQNLADLRPPVLLDPAFTVGPAFGTSSTPTAVLLDAEGRVASPIAAGAEEVLALAGRGQEQRQPASVQPRRRGDRSTADG